MLSRTYVLQKFRSDPTLRSLLLGTGNAVIAGMCKGNQNWGTGLPVGTDLPPNEWPGNNLLGWALMAVRCRLRAAASQCEDYNLPPSPADCATRFTGHQNADRPDADSRPPLSSHGATQCSDVTRHDSHTHPPTTDGPHRRHAPDIEPSCHTAEGDTALAHLLCTETLESNLDKVSPTTCEPGAETAHQWDHATRHVLHEMPG